MPLQRGTSKEAIHSNIAEMIKTGHKPEQAVAAAYHTAELHKRADKLRSKK